MTHVFSITIDQQLAELEREIGDDLFPETNVLHRNRPINIVL